MRKIPYTLAVVLCISALLAGCNLPFLANSQDNASVATAAALTVQAQLATAAPATATFTPVPFPTIPPVVTTVPPTNTVPAATATSSCDVAQFVTDVTIPDNTVVASGDTFTKTWRLKNTGTCSWTPSYAVVFVSGAQMNGPAVQALAGNVNPGQTVDVTVNLTAPTANGTYTGHWALRNAAGVLFSKFYVQIVVNDGTGGGGPFAVTHVAFTVTGTCPNFHIAVAITTNDAGTVNYHRVWSDGGTDTTPGTLDFATAGTKTVNFDQYFGTAGGSGWMDIYIDSPNHQQFGRANYSCP